MTTVDRVVYRAALSRFVQDVRALEKTLYRTMLCETGPVASSVRRVLRSAGMKSPDAGVVGNGSSRRVLRLI